MERFVVIEQLGEDEMLLDTYRCRLHPLYRSLNFRFISVEDATERASRPGFPDWCGEVVMPSGD